MTQPANPGELLRSRRYLALMLAAAVLGAPVSAAAYGFLALASYLQREVFTGLPHGLGLDPAPAWWPLPVLALGGAAAGLAIRYLPGHGGASPADGFAVHAPPGPARLPGVLLAALATLSCGAVLGPEMPLIAMGGGLALLAVRLARREVPAQAVSVLAAAGSFAAVSTLLGSPIVGAFLLMEASGLGGPALGLTLLPGLLAAGVGSLIFTGLGSWTGLGTFSLALPGLPPARPPQPGEFAWAVAIGLAAAVAGTAIRQLGRWLQRYPQRWRLAATPVSGLAVAGLAIGYARGTGKSPSDVLFSGQSELGPLMSHAAGYSAGALVLLLACKGLAYGVSLSSFRGGPTFPAMFIGAAAGIALSRLPGLPLVDGMAMGIGAMCVVMLTLPLTSVLLAGLLVFSDGPLVLPLVIVAVVVAHLATVRLAPPKATRTARPPAGSGQPGQALDEHPAAEHDQHQDQQGAPVPSDPGMQRR